MRMPSGATCAAKVQKCAQKICIFGSQRQQPLPANTSGVQRGIEEANDRLLLPEGEEEGPIVQCEDGEYRSWYQCRSYSKDAQMAVFGKCRLNGKLPAPDGSDGAPTRGQLARDLAGCYYWSGNVIIDYIWFTFQWHPLIGILLSHPGHPWSKKERFCQFMVENLWTALPTLAIQEACNGEKALVTYYTTVYVTIPCCAISYFLYYLLILDIYFDDLTLGPKLARISGPCCYAMGKCATAVACGFLCCCFCASIFVSMIAMAFHILDKVSGGHVDEMDQMTFFNAWLAVRFRSWWFWFIYMSLMPYVGFFHGWYLEAKQVREGQEATGFMDAGASEGA